MRTIQADSADPLSSRTQAQRDNLYKQIQAYRTKLSQYQLLQKEFNEINIHINASQSSKPEVINKMLKHKSNVEQNIKPINAKRNSHKKVKIYELQKKFQKVSRQHDQRRNTYERNLNSHNKILWGIEDLSAKIQDEKQISQNLKSLFQQIQSQLQLNSSKFQKELNCLEQTVLIKQSCNFQRKTIRENINRTRAMILNLANNLTQELSFSSSDEAIHSNPTVQLSLDHSVNHKHRNAVNQMSLWLNKQMKRIEALIDKHEIGQQKSVEHLQQFYKQKKQLISNQIVVKHHKLTINLYTSKIKQYQKMIGLYKNTVQVRNSTIKAVSSKINKLEGQSGYLRGRIGVTIEQQRLAKSLNILLESDLDKNRQKYHYLQFILNILHKKAQ